MAKRLAREHGSERGFQQHHTHREVPCRPCLAGHALYERAGIRCARGLGWPMVAHR